MNKKEYWEKVEKDNKDIMTRMHPAVLIPGILVGLIAVSYTHLTLPTNREV